MERGMRARKILSPEARAEFEEKMRRKAEAAGEGGGDQEAKPKERRKIKLPESKGAQLPAGGPVPARGEPFEERYRRVTTYLEKDVYATVQALRRSGRVASVTALYNAALREYINRYYGEDNGD